MKKDMEKNITDKTKKELLNQNPSSKDFDAFDNVNKSFNSDKDKDKEPPVIPNVVPNPILDTTNAVSEVLANNQQREETEQEKPKKEKEEPKSILDKIREKREKNKTTFAPQLQEKGLRKEEEPGINNYNVGIQGLNPGQDQRVYHNITDYRDYIDRPLQSDYLDYNRAVGQSNWKKFGSATTRFAMNVLPEIVNQGAAVVEGIGSMLGATDERGNAVSDTMKEVMEWTNSEVAPIYLKNQGESLAFDDFGWYMDRGSSLATSVTAFLVLGKLTGGASMFTRLTNVLSREGAKAMMKVASKELPKGGQAFNTLARTLGSDKAKKVASILDNVTSSFALTTAEGAGVAEEVFNKTRQENYRKYIDEGASIEEATARATEDAWGTSNRAFGFNMTNLALNMTSTGMFLKSLPASRTLALKPRTLKRSAFKMGGESLQESGEELVNFLSEKFATEDFDSFLSNLSKYVFEDEALEAMLLGAAGGLGQTGLTLTGQYIPTKTVNGKRISERDLFNQNFAAQEEIRSNIEKFSDAKYEDVIDLALNVQEKIKSHNRVYKYQEQLTALAEQIRNNKDDSKFKGLFEKYNKINKELKKEEANSMVNTAQNAFKNGMAETLINSLEGIKSQNAEELKKKGYDEDYEKKLDNAIETIKDLETVYNLTSSLVDGERAFELKGKELYYKRFKNDAQLDYNTYKKEVEVAMANLLNDSPITSKGDKIEVSLQNGTDKEGKDNIFVGYKSNYLNNLNKKIEQEEAKPKEEQKNLKQLKAEKEAIEKDLDDFVSTIESKEPFRRLTEQGKLIESLEKNEKDFSKLYDKLVSTDGQNDAFKKLMDERFEYEAKKKQENAQRQAKNKKNSKAKKKSDDKKRANPKDPTDTNTNSGDNTASTTLAQQVKNINEIVDNINTIEYERFIQLLNLSDENMMAEFYHIISEAEDNDISKVMWGYVQKFKDKIKKSKDYEIIDTFVTKTTVGPSLDKLLAKDDYIKDYNEFVGNDGLKSIADRVDSEFSINVSDNDEDSEHTIDFINSLQKDPDKSKRFHDFMDTLFESSKLDANNDSFKYIIRILENRLGEPTVNKLFYKIQGYFSMKSGKAANNRKDTFLNKDKREEERKERKRRLKSKSLEDFPLMTEKEIKEYNEAKERANIIANGFYIGKEEALSKTNSKTKTAHNKLAFKSGVFKQTDEGYGELEELNNNLSSQVMLGQVQPGDKLEFYIEPTHEDSDGNIYSTIQVQAEENGKKLYTKEGDPVLVYKTQISYKEGHSSDYSTENATDLAPIKVMLNGEVLNDVYLHVVPFIDSHNVAQDAETIMPIDEQKENLRRLRRSILEGDDVSAVVSEVGNGHLIKAQNRSIKVNMPDAEVSIIADNMAKFNENSFDFDAKYEGQIAIYDSSFETPVLGNKPKLSILQIDSILTIMEAKLLPKAALKEKHHVLIKEIKNKYGFDLRSGTKANYRGFNNLINNYLYTKSFDKDFEISDVTNDLSDNQAVFYMRNFANKGIEIKATDKGFKPLNIKFDGSNYTEKNVIDALDNMKRLLSKSYLNISQPKLKGNQAYSMPLVNNKGVISEKAYDTYTDYVKSVVNTNYQTLEYNGQRIGKVQRSIFFEANYPEATNHVNSFEKSKNVPEKSEKKPKKEVKPKAQMFDEDGNFNENVEEGYDPLDNDFDDEFSITVSNNVEPANTYNVEKIIKEEVEYKTKDGKPCAEVGAKLSNINKGYRWTIKEDFKDIPSHSTGGKEIDFKGIKLIVEKDELLLINTVGDEVVIPAKYNLEVKGMIKDNCQNCLDSLIRHIPIIKQKL